MSKKLIVTPFSKNNISTGFCYPITKHVFNNYEIIKVFVEHIIKLATDEKNKGVSINLFCTGSSGSFLCGILSYELIKTLNVIVDVVYVRKEHEIAHSSKVPTFYVEGRINILVDDFIDSGDTIARIIQSIKKSSGICFETDYKFDYIIISRCSKNKLPGLSEITNNLIADVK